jgi:hypothetical protein
VVETDSFFIWVVATLELHLCEIHSGVYIRVMHFTVRNLYFKSTVEIEKNSEAQRG